VATWQFLTVAEELLGEASAVAAHYVALGYKVKEEPRELGYPFAPTLRCKRRPTTVFGEVDRRVRMERVGEWAAFASSAASDTQVVAAVPATARVSSRQNVTLKTMGVGLLIVSDGTVTEAMAPRDLAMNVSLPNIGRDPTAIRAALGPAYEHFARSQWREGFGDACVVLEGACRKYLWKALKSGRTIVLKENGNPKLLKKAQVDNLTMGQLAGDFSRMQKQNHCDSILAAGLAALNDDRILVAHKKRETAAERALRDNVGPQMWRIVHALREIWSASGAI
jgi:hypothetical protein